ncbi:hypothetical protein B1R94_25985 [Mycolicibacterium litorale]|nr:hypothetical protein B1R94_25985 [Mycolicibacterium litorale]
MAKFRASKGYHFSEDGTEETTWAKFDHVPKSDPAVYEFETDEKSEIASLRKLIEDEVPGYTDIVEVAEKPAKKAPAKKAPAKRAGSKAADKADGDDEGGDGDPDGGDDSGDADGDAGEGQNG